MARLTRAVGGRATRPVGFTQRPRGLDLIEKTKGRRSGALRPMREHFQQLIKGTEPIEGPSLLSFAVDAGFDPYSLRLSNGPGSLAANAGVPLNQQTAV